MATASAAEGVSGCVGGGILKALLPYTPMTALAMRAM